MCSQCGCICGNPYSNAKEGNPHTEAAKPTQWSLSDYLLSDAKCLHLSASSCILPIPGLRPPRWSRVTIAPATYVIFIPLGRVCLKRQLEEEKSSFKTETAATSCFDSTQEVRRTAVRLSWRGFFFSFLSAPSTMEHYCKVSRLPLTLQIWPERMRGGGGGGGGGI